MCSMLVPKLHLDSLIVYHVERVHVTETKILDFGKSGSWKQTRTNNPT